MKRDLFTPEHDLFRETVRSFLRREVAPKLESWEQRGGFEHDIFEKAGAAGLLCPTAPEAYGGAAADLLYSVAIIEEAAEYSNFGLTLAMHSEIVTNYILHYGNDHLRQKYLPRMISGEWIGALAMTEPNTGSDVKAIKTKAQRDEEHYILSGSKIFITNASTCDFVVVAAKTDPAAGTKGISLIIVDATMAGFTKGRPLKKIGLKSQDTGELFFENVRVPVTQLLGQENSGFAYLMQELPWERLQIGISAVAAAEAAYRWTVEYVRNRQAFGKSLADFQNTRFVLADLKTQIEIGRTFIDRCIGLMLRHELDAQAASMENIGAVKCRGGWSTPAFSCMVATASWPNIRSPAPMWMHVRSAFTAEQAKS